jgi:glycosyltransferase involved in cell wall biosynthesis
MYSFPMKVLVLNELHPDEQAGAATIALDYAMSLSKISNTVFMHTSKPSHVSKSDALQFMNVERKERRKYSGYMGELINVLTDLFGIRVAINILRHIKSQTPDLIWIHQIGNYIPRILLLLLPFIAPAVMTVHDYSFIVPRKLYPKDLDSRRLKILNVKYATQNERLMNIGIAILKRSMYGSRRFILRRYLSRVKIVCISEQQAQIYRSYGFCIYKVIPNGIAKCKCDNTASLTRLNSVLFLGRITGKGLDRLLTSTVGSEIRTVLAGGEDLKRKIDEYPQNLNVSFLGRLDRNSVFREIHQTTFVYLASDCFDVFPTTGIEAIRHGAIPIVSDTTGLRDLVHQIDPLLVLDSNQSKVPLDHFLRTLEVGGERIYQRLQRVNDQLPTVEVSLEEYLELMRTS